MPIYRTIVAPCRFEIEPIKKSRFLAAVSPAASPEEVMNFVTVIRQEQAAARHHCFAWRLVDGRSRTWDDGEPGGTGGQPILTRIDGQQLRGVVVVVTRYFGGVKLGKGGLIRAYGGAAGEVLERAAITEVHETTSVDLAFDYSDQRSVDAVLHALSLEPTSKSYGARVYLQVDVPVESTADLDARLRERTAGRVGCTD